MEDQGGSGLLTVGWTPACLRMLDGETTFDWTVNNQHINTTFVVQHAQMLVVRKEGKAHDQYNSFRSAFELMEAVGREPSDSFKEMADDLPPLDMLEKRMMVQYKSLLGEISYLKAENNQLKAQLVAETSQLKAENGDLRCRLEKLEHGI